MTSHLDFESMTFYIESITLAHRLLRKITNRISQADASWSYIKDFKDLFFLVFSSNLC